MIDVAVYITVHLLQLYLFTLFVYMHCVAIMLTDILQVSCYFFPLYLNASLTTLIDRLTVLLDTLIYWPDFKYIAIGIQVPF